jgi:hypothetical protein
VLFYGTRCPIRILDSDRIEHSPGGFPSISLSRSPDVAAYFSALPRDELDEEGLGAVFVLDRKALRYNYRLENYNYYNKAEAGSWMRWSRLLSGDLSKSSADT